MAFTLPNRLVQFHRMKTSTSPVQLGGRNVELKAFPGARPNFTQVSISGSKKGHFATGLTIEEETFLEPLLGLKKGDLSSVYPNLDDKEKVMDCYWLQERARISLPSSGSLTLNLSVPLDYIHYKNLTQMTNIIAVGMKGYSEHPTAEYVLIDEHEEVEQKHSKLSAKKKAYKHIDDWTSTQYSDYLWSQGQDPRHLKPDTLEALVMEGIEKNPDYFLKQVTDKNYKEKVQIGELVRFGVLEVRGKSYKFNGAPLADSLEEMVDVWQDKSKQGTKLEILKALKERKG